MPRIGVDQKLPPPPGGSFWYLSAFEETGVRGEESNMGTVYRLLQLHHGERGRRIALVEGEKLLLLDGFSSLYGLARTAIEERIPLRDLVQRYVTSTQLDYGSVYEGGSEWKILPSFDHPEEPARCLVSGTGLTHKASAQRRQAMHEQEKGPQRITDSMRMFQWGLEGGKPRPGEIGIQPEWFYKGRGEVLRGHGDPLEVPPYAEDGGEEAEVAAAYLIDSRGRPWRVGLSAANEFSDHRMEARNYLYLAPAKLRSCSLGPELVIGASFEQLSGWVRIEREGRTLWRERIASGEANMSHSLANLEHHHFKYAAHRRPGDVHIHFFGADAFSFGSGVELADGDVMEVAWEGLGRPLRNPIRIDRSTPSLVSVRDLASPPSGEL